MNHAEFKARILAFAPGATADAVAAFAVSLANAGVDPDRPHWPAARNVVPATATCGVCMGNGWVGGFECSYCDGSGRC